MSRRTVSYGKTGSCPRSRTPKNRTVAFGVAGVPAHISNQYTIKSAKKM
ncbi:hypothetical protein CLOSTASPAR_05833 [[Clostridium] asparagiforme DSM 15981]|uniref:Uncharacterized protein n=1 Tax=[Clostridium] asparagiforme DSM 15981 TaxID=518636 RepID=C0D983_9FIRM|nr:hypothetical protein CLOSTASPAR_05833 [[Clostridium] asparagiforme DSM 15981]